MVPYPPAPLPEKKAEEWLRGCDYSFTAQRCCLQTPDADAMEINGPTQHSSAVTWICSGGGGGDRRRHRRRGSRRRKTILALS